MNINHAFKYLLIVAAVLVIVITVALTLKAAMMDVNNTLDGYSSTTP